jgi:hypothetical protein
MTLFDAETRGEIVGYNMEKLDLNTIRFLFPQPLSRRPPWGV